MNNSNNNTNNQPQKTTVFVYGTLLTGHGNWQRILAPSKGVKATTIDQYTMRSMGGFPAVYDAHEGTPSTEIVGECFLVDDATVQRLDALEGHPNWYKREEVRVELEGGVETVAWMYIMPRQTSNPRGLGQRPRNNELIASGNWNEFTGRQAC